MPTETPTKPYEISAGEGLADVWWKTGRVAIKTSGAETGGRFSQAEVSDPRGTAPPMHVHHQEDETFYVLEGQVAVFIDDGRIEISAGDYAFVPRGTPHSYLVRSERARMLVTFSPAGFEGVFVELGIAADCSEPPVDPVMPSPEEFARRLAPYGCEIVGPPPDLNDLRS
jgi:quercetin dioxygenase-like cupin family protein